ncbi:MAG: (deoxy)nucleoside triphosphate pyrophosphohydrolase [Pseudomonadota bacterium]
MTNKISIRVAAGILRRGSQYFIAQRLPGDRGEGAWEFPGGKVEPGESDSDALRRELAEELGIEITESALLMTLTHEYPERFVDLVFFEVLAWHGEPEGCEGQATRWCERNALADVDWLPANGPVVAALTSSSKY